MKTYSLLLLLTLFLSTKNEVPPSSETINPIIGDISYLEKYGVAPDESVDEDIRIATHLEYVAGVLQNRDISHLSPTQKANRAQNIKNLKDYAAAEIFPRNYDYEGERKPCFIDRDGKICAVGYIVEQSSSREFAEEINRSFQYAEIEEMESEKLENWITESGLTKEEYAMIQPSYYFQIVNRYATQTIVSSGINSGIIGLNSMNIIREKNRKWIPLLGMTTGAVQTVYGIKKFANHSNENHYNTISPPPSFYRQMRDLSKVNIAIGSANLLLSTGNLFLQRRRKNQAISWNIYGLPQRNNAFAFGVNMVKRF